MIISKMLPRNGSLFYRWLLSYISILLIPVIISSIVSMYSMQVMIREANSANEGMLKLLQKNIDEKINTFKGTAYRFCLNNDLEAIMKAEKEFTESQQYNIYRLIKQIADSVETNEYLDDIFIYHKSTGSVISKTSKMDTAYFHSYYFPHNKLSFNELIKLMDDKHMMDYCMLEKRIGDGGNVKVVAFFQSLPLISPGSSAGTLVGIIPEAKFQEIINDLKWVDQYELLVMDGNGQIIMTNGPQNLPAEVVRDVARDDLVQVNQKYRGKDFIVTSISSSTTNWRFVLVIPSEIFLEKTIYIRKITLFAVLLCVLAGGIIAYLFSKKNYNPLNKIVQTLLQKTALTAGKKENEYSIINNAINENIMEIKGAYNRLEKQSKALRESFLKDLLKGMSNNETTMKESAGQYDIDLSGLQFAVILFCIEDFSAFKTESENKPNNSSFKLAIFVLSNVVRELIEGENKGYLIDLDGMLACLINFKNSDTVGNKSEINCIVKKCQWYIQEQMHIYFTAAISNIHEDLSEIPEAYHEVMDAMEYRKLIGSSGIIKYENIENHKYTYDYPMQTEQILINCIKTGDPEKSKKILNEVIQANLYDTSYSGEMAKCLMFDLTSTIVKTMYEICDIEFIESVQPLKRLLNCNTVMEMKTQIMLVLEIVCRYVGENDKNNYQLSKEVIEYINANYMNLNFNVSYISEIFKLTRPYLSMLFKSQTGQTLSDYINKVRLEKAKQLLKESKLSIFDTANKVGYSNSNVFIRAFKKYEGITPGEYREI